VPGNMSKGQWRYPRGYLRLVSTVTAFAAILTPLDSTIVSVSLPAIARGLRASYLETIWVPMGYLVSLSAFLLLFGRLGDVRGRRRVFKYGASFVAYRKGPGLEHAPFVIHYYPPDEPFDPVELVRAGRVSHSVRKVFVLATAGPGARQPIYITFKWLRP